LASAGFLKFGVYLVKLRNFLKTAGLVVCRANSNLAGNIKLDKLIFKYPQIGKIAMKPKQLLCKFATRRFEGAIVVPGKAKLTLVMRSSMRM